MFEERAKNRQLTRNCQWRRRSDLIGFRPLNAQDRRHVNGKNGEVKEI